MNTIGVLPLLPRNMHTFLNGNSATTEIYTLSLHDALPIFGQEFLPLGDPIAALKQAFDLCNIAQIDRKSTRLNSSHVAISYAVICLTKKRCTTRSSTRASMPITTGRSAPTSPGARDSATTP